MNKMVQPFCSLCGLRGHTPKHCGLHLHDGEVQPLVNSLNEQIGGDHYKGLEIQPVEFIHANGLTFLEGNIIKYVCRHAKKGGRKDIEKVIHYARMLLDLEY